MKELHLRKDLDEHESRVNHLEIIAKNLGIAESSLFQYIRLKFRYIDEKGHDEILINLNYRKNPIVKINPYKKYCEISEWALRKAQNKRYPNDGEVLLLNYIFQVLTENKNHYLTRNLELKTPFIDSVPVKYNKHRQLRLNFSSKTKK